MGKRTPGQEAPVTPWVKRLLLANVGVFIGMMMLPRPQLEAFLSATVLVPAQVLVRPWTIVTYMFLHAGLWHLLFNMIALFFFGPRLEARLGSRHFLYLYLLSGFMGAALSVFTPYARIVGASGAVFGVLLGFALYWPHERIYIWAILPVEARWLVIFLTALSLYGGITGAQGGIAHFAHLGGFLGGWIFLKWRDRNTGAARFKRQVEQARAGAGSLGSREVERWRHVPLDQLHPLNREEFERILEKVGARGASSLTPDERGFMNRFVRRNEER